MHRSLLMLATTIVVACPAFGQTLDIRTGVDATGAKIPINSADDDWVLNSGPAAEGPYPRSATVVDPLPSWSVAPTTRWISIDNDAIGAPGEYAFQYTFSVPAGVSVAILGSVRTANDARISINGNVIAQTFFFFNSPAVCIETSEQSFFNIPGNNVITVLVRNLWQFPGPIGMDLDGIISMHPAGSGDCSLREGNVDTGSGNPPADVLFIDTSRGDSCREMAIAANNPTPVSIISPPSTPNARYAIWIFDGDDSYPTPITLTTSSCITYFLGNAPRCLPVNRLGCPSSPNNCPCPCTFPLGRTSYSISPVTAGRLCLQLGYPQSPYTFIQKFPPGTYQVIGLVTDVNSINSPALPLSITNTIAVHALQ